MSPFPPGREPYRIAAYVIPTPTGYGWILYVNDLNGDQHCIVSLSNVLDPLACFADLAGTIATLNPENLNPENPTSQS